MESEPSYDYDSFTTAITRGLKLSQTAPKPTLTSVEQPSSSSSSSSSAVLPTAPVVFATVFESDELATPTLIPLQYKLLSVKVTAVANPHDALSTSQSVHVRFKAGLLIEKQFSNSPLILAVPVGRKGTLVSYEIRSPYYSKSVLHKLALDANYKPQLQNLYLVSLPRVEVLERDKEIAVLVCYAQDFNACDYEQVPFSIPGYVSQRPFNLMQTQKIRLILECRGSGTIRDCAITSHPLIDIITDERRRVYLQESRCFSNKDLTCSFTVTSQTTDQAKLFHQEMSFIRSVEEGVKLTSGPVDLSSPPQSVLPTAPVLYAVVSNMEIMDFETTCADRAFEPPALVPLQMANLSAKINAEPKPDSLQVQFKGRWCVHCIKKSYTCPLILAIPVGYGGCLLHYEIYAPSHSPTALKAEKFTASKRPQFQNLYLVALPPCEGGADVFIRFCYVQDVIQKEGLFSFTIPLSVPKYVSQIAEISSSKERIRLTLQCKDKGTITKCDVLGHNLLELISNEKMRVLLKESLGYSGKDLTCSFTVTW